MDISPVLGIINIDLIAYLREKMNKNIFSPQEILQADSMGQYLLMMRKFYFSINDSHIEDIFQQRNEQLKRTIADLEIVHGYFVKFQNIKDPKKLAAITFHQLISTIKNFVLLLSNHMKGNEEFDCIPSTISSNINENHFSIVKSKYNFPMALEYSYISSFSWFYYQHQNCDSLPFSVPKTKSTHYRGCDIHFKLPPLPNKRTSSKTAAPLCPQTEKKLREYLMYFKPSKKIW